MALVLNKKSVRGKRIMENYRVSSHFSMDFPRKEYVRSIGEAQRSIDIVCGEFDPIVYNTPNFVKRINLFLTYGGDLNVIFNGKTTEKKQAVKNIKSLSYNFMYMLSRQEQSALENVAFHWCPRRPVSHYAIIDDSTLIVEEVHKVGKPRDIYCFKENPSAVSSFKKRFLEMKSYCEPIKTSDLVQGIETMKEERVFQELQDLMITKG